MRHTRWLAPLLGVTLATTVAGPAGATRDASRVEQPGHPRRGCHHRPRRPPSPGHHRSRPTTRRRRSRPSRRASRSPSPSRTADRTSGRYSSPTRPTRATPSRRTRCSRSRTLPRRASTSRRSKPATPGHASSSSCNAKTATSNGTVDAAQPLDLQGVGDGSVGFEFPAHFNVQGSPLTLIFDYVGVRVGRAFVGFIFSNPSVQITQDRVIVNSVISRLQPLAHAVSIAEGGLGGPSATIPTGPVFPQPGQPSLGEHAKSVGFVATDSTVVRVYEGVDRVYRARQRFAAEGASCIGVKSNDCYSTLSDLLSAVADVRDAATGIATQGNSHTKCGTATLDFVNTINLLYSGVSPLVDLSNPDSTISEQSARAQAADADASYNEGLFDFRRACGEEPTLQWVVSLLPNLWG